LNEPALSIALHLLGIFVAALLLNRFLRVIAILLIRPATGQSGSVQAREQQTRTLAGVVYGGASKVVWVVAILTALDKVGINPVPALTLAGLASLAIGFGAQSLVRDVIAGFYIVLKTSLRSETRWIGETAGRVEHMTLRRTVVRDMRGAVVTIANGEIRTVANLSRDWSQSFVASA
jgi:small conductance mechanosensitive channel